MRMEPDEAFTAGQVAYDSKVLFFFFALGTTSIAAKGKCCVNADIWTN